MRSSPGMAERPHQEVVADIVVDLGEAERLQSLDEIERRHVLHVLTALRGNRDETSRVLGISRRTLSRMIQRWNLPRRFD